MSNAEIKERLKKYYGHLDSDIFSHGKDYFQIANLAYNSDQFKPYPILTLIGLALEHFFKSFDTKNKTQKVIHPNNDQGVLIPPTYKQIQSNNKNGHDLYNLFNFFSKNNPELYLYINDQYLNQFDSNLTKLLIRNRKLFENTRYAYENEANHYHLSDLQELYELTKFLYQTIDDIFKRNY